ncbi:A cutinase-like protein from cryptococcus Sp [Xylariaceae sp. FL0804]|nr:A cutinase-like protein from cryptococcus Sp [Xylariaceae sp. FL0804]
MHASALLALLPFVALSTTASPVDGVLGTRASSCSSYTLINTRGTGETQGESSAFRTMNSRVTSQKSGGTIYNTVYSAGFTQDSSAATTDIVNKVRSTLQRSPDECFILQGYSQGASGTVDALAKLTGDEFAAVKGVFMVGDPRHKSGLSCNVDNNGGTTTKNVNGLEVAQGSSIPSNWVSKTLDVCIYGDGVCDTTHGYGIDSQHLQYPNDSATQDLGTEFILAQLGN